MPAPPTPPSSTPCAPAVTHSTCSATSPTSPLLRTPRHTDRFIEPRSAAERRPQDGPPFLTISSLLSRLHYALSGLFENSSLTDLLPEKSSHSPRPRQHPGVRYHHEESRKPR